MNTKRNYYNLFLIIAELLNILAIILIIIPIIHLTPLTIVISAVFGGGLLVISIIIYALVVIKDLIKRGVL